MGLRDSGAWAAARKQWYLGLERFPSAWAAWVRRPGRHVADRDTDIVVEGAGGSANTFVREALLRADPTLRIASHCHRAAHVRYGLRLGLPVLVLLREPVDAVASFLTRVPKHRTLVEQLDRYERFYTPLGGLHDRVALACFDDATTRLGTVVEMVNAQFGTAIAPYRDDDPVMRRDVEHTIESWARASLGEQRAHAAAMPRAERSGHREEVQAQLRRTLPEQLARCEALYEASAAVARDRMARHLATTTG